MMKDTFTPTAPGRTPATEVVPDQHYGNGGDAPRAAQFCSVQEEQAFTSPLVPG